MKAFHWSLIEYPVVAPLTIFSIRGAFLHIDLAIGRNKPTEDENKFQRNSCKQKFLFSGVFSGHQQADSGLCSLYGVLEA